MRKKKEKKKTKRKEKNERRVRRQRMRRKIRCKRENSGCRDKWIVDEKKDRGPVSASSQYRSTALLITLHQPSTQSAGKSMRLLPCTCHSLWAWCVLHSPIGRCPASDRGIWCPFHAGSSEQYRFQQHKICEGEIQRMMCLTCLLVPPSGQDMRIFIYPMIVAHVVLVSCVHHPKDTVS